MDAEKVMSKPGSEDPGLRSRLLNLCDWHCLSDRMQWHEDLADIYEEMAERNLRAISVKGLSHDTGLCYDDDSRRCLASYAFFDSFTGSDRLRSLMTQLKEIFPDDALYEYAEECGPSVPRLHYTFLQHVGFSATFQSNWNIGYLIETIMESFLEPFSITYVGTILIPTGLVMIGFPSVDLNFVRDEFRALLKEEGVENLEPYFNNIVHSTVLRFAKPVTSEQKERIFQLNRDFEACFLGRAIISTFSVGKASWKMTKKELRSEKDTTIQIRLYCKIGSKLQIRSGGLRRTSIITHRGLDPEGYGSQSLIQRFENFINRGFSLEFDPIFSKDGVGFISHGDWVRNEAGRFMIFELTSDHLQAFGLVELSTVLDLLLKSSAENHAVHLKGNRQDYTTLRHLAGLLNSKKYAPLKTKLFVFDLLPRAASFLKSLGNDIQTGASVSHDYDVERFGSCVYKSLISVRQAKMFKSLYDWVWLDEWDRTGPDGSSKVFITERLVNDLKRTGFKIAVVSPELHATSPELAGGEIHQDALNYSVWRRRLNEIVTYPIDGICTDWPEKVYRMAKFQSKDQQLHDSRCHMVQ